MASIEHRINRAVSSLVRQIIIRDVYFDTTKHQRANMAGETSYPVVSVGYDPYGNAVWTFWDDQSHSYHVIVGNSATHAAIKGFSFLPVRQSA